MSEPQQTPEPQAELDYSQETDEQLEARMQAGEALVVEREDEPAPVMEPEPEAPAEVEADPGAEAEATDGAEAQAEPEEEPAAPEQTQAAGGDDLEELRLRLEQERLARERSELIGGRAANELGELRKQVAQLTQLQQQTPQVAPDALDDPYQQPPVQPPYQPPPSGVGDLQAKVAGLEQQERTRVVNQEIIDFQAQHFGEDAEAFQRFSEASRESIQRQLAPYQNMNLDNEGARKLLNITLSMALADYRLAERRKVAEGKRTSQVPEKRQAKQAATVSGSGATPAPKARPKSPEEMTAEEADAALIAEFGDGHHRRR